MTSVYVLTAIDQNFLLNSKGETFILGMSKERSLRRNNNNNKSNKAEEIQLANVSVNSKPDHPPGRPPGIRIF